jgi:two-component system response regulator FlrC
MHRAAILSVGDEVDCDAIVLGETPAFAQAAPAPTPMDTALGGDLKARERELILDALRAVNGNRKKTCERLGISARTLRYKLAKFREEGIVLPGEEPVAEV